MFRLALIAGMDFGKMRLESGKLETLVTGEESGRVLAANILYSFTSSPSLLSLNSRGSVTLQVLKDRSFNGVNASKKPGNSVCL